jgi:hypothetical protein
MLQLNFLDEYWRSMLVDWRLVIETNKATIIRQIFQSRQMNRVDSLNSRSWRTSSGSTALSDGSVGPVSVSVSMASVLALCWFSFFALASSSVSGRRKMGSNPATAIIRPKTYGIAGSNVIR